MFDFCCCHQYACTDASCCSCCRWLRRRQAVLLMFPSWHVLLLDTAHAVAAAFCALCCVQPTAAALQLRLPAVSPSVSVHLHLYLCRYCLYQVLYLSRYLCLSCVLTNALHQLELLGVDLYTTAAAVRQCNIQHSKNYERRLGGRAGEETHTNTHLLVCSTCILANAHRLYYGVLTGKGGHEIV